jgi:hypothetical protein
VANTIKLRDNNLKSISPLLLDLQSHFLQIRALSETSASNPENLNEIQLVSRHALSILDYAMFALDMAQTELPLTTISAAAIARDVTENLRLLAEAYEVDLDLDVTSRLEPVLTNESAAKGALYGLASSLIVSPNSAKKRTRIVIAAQETKPNSQRLGVYSPNLLINPTKIKLSRLLAGKARSAAPTEVHNSGLGLVVSDQLTQALSSKLSRFNHRGNKGIGFYLPMSPQLSML